MSSRSTNKEDYINLSFDKAVCLYSNVSE